MIEKIAEEIKEEILGKQFELSFSFVSKKKIWELNKIYRKKDEPTDILSFLLEKNVGEILICKKQAEQKWQNLWQKNSEIDFPKLEDYLLFLVIHGLLHLKGLEHSSKMRKYEFQYYSRYRCRDARSARGSSRTKSR